MKRVSLDRALLDPHLLALNGLSWLTWRSVLKAAHGEPLSAGEAKAFGDVAGGRAPPGRKVRQLAVVASRRAGKGRAAGALAVYAASLVDHSSVLAPGEVGVIACLSPTKDQSKIVLDYCRGYFENSPVLRGELREVVDNEIRLKNGTVIATLTNDFRTLRGRTLLLAILDEASFLRDETSKNPDIEASRALLPGLSTTGGMLCVMSSPYRRAGLLFNLHRDHFGKDTPDILVVAGASTQFNPTLDLAVIKAADESDPLAARSEWHGEFRSDLAQFLDDESIEFAIDRNRPHELPPRDEVTYFAFTDPSGGKHDAFSLCICHREGAKVVIDVVRGHRRDPHVVAGEYAGLARDYRCTTIVGDAYAGDWVSGAFLAAGIDYQRSRLTRSELYLEGLPLWTRGLVSIPDNPMLHRELRLLERRTARSGKDSVDHGTGGSDDFANAVFGAINLAADPRDETANMSFDFAGICSMGARSDPYSALYGDSAATSEQQNYDAAMGISRTLR